MFSDAEAVPAPAAAALKLISVESDEDDVPTPKLEAFSCIPVVTTPAAKDWAVLELLRAALAEVSAADDNAVLIPAALAKIEVDSAPVDTDDPEIADPA